MAWRCAEWRRNCGAVRGNARERRGKARSGLAEEKPSKARESLCTEMNTGREALGSLPCRFPAWILVCINYTTVRGGLATMEQSQARQKARALLWAWGRALERCKQLEADLKDLEELCAGLHDPTRAQQLTGMPGSGAISDSTAKTAQRALERLEIYEAEIERVQAEIQETLGMKRAIDGFVADQIAVDRRILELRYVRECSWVYIAIKMDSDESTMKKREAKIVDKLYNSSTFFHSF